MPSRYVLVMDGGSSACRCVAFDEAGRIVARKDDAWKYRSRDDDSSLARELDAQGSWETICRLVRECMNEAGIAPSQVGAVTVTTQRQGVAFLGSDGAEIYVGPNTDLRAVFEGAALDDEYSERIYHTTGHLPSFLFASAKLRWFQLHQPETYSRIATVLTLADWMVWKLTGEAVSEASLAADAGLLDCDSRDWCSPLMADLGLTDNGHVPLREAGTVAGTVTRAAAEQTGLSLGTPVPLAGADTQCGLLGMGVFEPGQVGIVAGWSVPLQMITERPVRSPEMSTWAGCFLLDGRWVLESSAGDGGNTHSWLARNLWADADHPFNQMDSASAGIPSGSDGATAFLGPSRMDMAKLGLKTGGVLFPVPITFNEMDRAHLARSAMESLAYAIRANLEQIESLAGTTAVDVALGGGLSRSRTLVKVIVDVLGRPVRVSPVPDVSAIGAYLCAAKALGRYDTLELGAEESRRSMELVHPDPVQSAEYDEQVERWVRLSGQLEALSL